MLTVKRMNRAEIWGDLQCAGGQRLAFVRNVAACTAHVTLTGTDDKLTFGIPINDPNIGLIAPGTVIRLWEDDATYDEWVITDDGRTTNNGVATFTAAPADQRLSRGDILGQADGLGVLRHDFPVVSLTPSEHLSLYVIPWLNAKGINWVSIGTIESATPIDISVSWESPLVVIQKIAAAANLEYQFRRNGAVGYKIDLLTQLGETALQSDFRLRKNIIDTGVQRSAAEQSTRLYPRGGQDGGGGDYATMGDAVWLASVVAGAVVTLADPVGGDPPIAFDGQLNGLYVERPNGARILINASSQATQQITLAALGVVAADLLHIRSDIDGTELTWLDSPADRASYGNVVAVLDVPEAPATRNLAPNPALRNWPGALPIGWSLQGGTVVAIKHTVLPEIQTGNASLRLDMNADGDGAVSPQIAVAPTAERPYFSGFVSLWVELGQARVEMLVTKADLSVVVLPLSPAVASSTLILQWEALGLSGIDFNALTAVSVAFRIVQNGGALGRFFIDSIQLTQSSAQQPFVEGSGSNKLWQAANNRLRTNGAPIGTYSSNVLDRARLDPATYGDDSAIVLGGKARVTDPRIFAVPLITRIVEVTRDYQERGKSTFTLSNKPEDLSGGLARPARPPRVTPDVTDAGVLAYNRCTPTIIAATADQITVEVTGSAPGGRVAQVQLVDLAGATQISGPAIGVLSPSTTQWVFARPIGASTVQILEFESDATGCVPDPGLLQIPPQGQGITASTCVITPTGTTSVSVSFSVTGADPANGGSNLTISVDSVVGVTGPTPTSVVGAPPVIQTYTVSRGVFGSGMGRVVFKSSCAGHVNGWDAIDIPPQDRDTQSVVCLPKIISQTDTQVTIQVDATSPNGGGTPVVRLSAINGNASLSSGAAIGTDVASGSQWTFNRGTNQSGPGEAKFRAHLTGFEDNFDSVSIPEQLQDDAGSLVVELHGNDVVINASGGSKALSALYTFSTGPMPTDAACRLGIAVSGRQWVVTLSNQMPNFGDHLYVKVIFYAGAGQTGREYPSLTAEVQRQGGKATKTIRGFWQAAGWKSQNGPVVSTDYKGFSASLTVSANNTPYNVREFLDLPDGAVIKETRAKVFRGNGNAVITHSLFRVPTTTSGSFTTIGAQQTSTSTGADETLVNSSLSENTSGFTYALEVTLQKGAADTFDNARALTWEVDYESADTNVTR